MVLRWQEETSETLYESRIFSIRRARFRNKQQTQECYLVDSPDWVNIIGVTTRKTVLFVRQFRFAARRITLEIPGGMVDPGETPAHAAARELRDETGHESSDWIALGSVDPNPALIGNRCYTFLARGCRQVDAATVDDQMEVLEHPLDEIPLLIAEGHISHALVAVAFQRFDLYERGLLKGV